MCIRTAYKTAWKAISLKAEKKTDVKVLLRQEVGKIYTLSLPKGFLI